MKTIILKVNNVAKTIAEHNVVTQDGQPTVVDAVENVNYELVDSDTGNAPENIFTKRLDDDLYITMNHDGRQSDLIIVGFYNKVGTELIGLAEDDSYYQYVPMNAQVDSFVAALDEGESKSQMLGGAPQASPWWVSASEISVFADTMLAANTADVEVISTNQPQVTAQSWTNDPTAIMAWTAGLAGIGIISSKLMEDDVNLQVKNSSPQKVSLQEISSAANELPINTEETQDTHTLATAKADETQYQDEFIMLETVLSSQTQVLSSTDNNVELSDELVSLVELIKTNQDAELDISAVTLSEVVALEADNLIDSSTYKGEEDNTIVAYADDVNVTEVDIGHVNAAIAMTSQSEFDGIAVDSLSSGLDHNLYASLLQDSSVYSVPLDIAVI